MVNQVIDSYCHLNSTYHDSWRKVEETLDTSASSGVTTVVDYPMMRRKKPGASEASHMIRKRNTLQRYKLRTDVALMALLPKGGLQDIKEVIDAGVFGFQAFLTPPFQEDEVWFSNDVDNDDQGTEKTNDCP